MNPALAENDIFSQLNSEHQLISEFLVYFEKLNWMFFNENIPPPQLVEKSFFFIENYIQGFHHAREEEILFPEAFMNNLEKNGGPECNKFFQHFLDSQFFEKFQDYRIQYEIPQHKHTDVIQEVINANSPLTIPISEHEAGHYATQIMKILWKKIHNGEANLAKDFSRFGRWYIEMLNFHIQKEETCLFLSLQKIFSREQIQSINMQSKRINQAFSLKMKTITDAFNEIKLNLES